MNPELEEIRKSAPGPPDHADVLKDILEKTNNIHAAFLFLGEGEKLLQQLCLCLCATKQSLIYSGWKELGVELGLDRLLQESLANCNINNQDPVYNMLIAYVQKEGATIGKIYSGLSQIKRPDVIMQTYSLVLNFHQELRKSYSSLTEKNIKPFLIRKPPHILRNLDCNKKFDSLKQITCQKIEPKIEREILCCNAEVVTKVLKREFSVSKSTKNEEIKGANPEKAPENKEPKPKCSKYVLLTHSSDGIEPAQKIAREIRKVQIGGKKIGVILLQEQSHLVNADPEIFISECFAQCNFVVPVLTPGYLNSVSGLEQPTEALENLDSDYVNYIYRLITNSFMRNGCRNVKIRCIIPDEQFNRVQKHHLASNPEFRIWTKLSQVNMFATRILQSAI